MIYVHTQHPKISVNLYFVIQKLIIYQNNINYSIDSYVYQLALVEIVGGGN